MAMNSDTTGVAIADLIKTFRPIPGDPISDVQLENMWKQIVQKIEDMINNADITLTASDISTNVPATGILDGQGQACTGAAIGVNNSVTLGNKIS